MTLKCNFTSKSSSMVRRQSWHQNKSVYVCRMSELVQSVFAEAADSHRTFSQSDIIRRMFIICMRLPLFQKLKYSLSSQDSSQMHFSSTVSVFRVTWSAGSFRHGRSERSGVISVLVWDPVLPFSDEYEACEFLGEDGCKPRLSILQEFWMHGLLSSGG